MHLLLKNCGSSEPKATAKVTEITEGEEAPAEAAIEEKDGATSEIIPLATRTKEGMAALVKVLKGLPGRGPTPHVLLANMQKRSEDRWSWTHVQRSSCREARLSVSSTSVTSALLVSTLAAMYACRT